MAFSPLYDKETISKYAGLYRQNPAAFTQEQAETLRDHAESYDLPFALTDEHHKSSISSLLGQAAVGYMEGFTTFQQVDNKPGDEWERLSRRLGNLFGFMGLVPPVTKIFRHSKLAQGIEKLAGKSFPMMIADKAADAVGKRVGEFVKAAGGGEHATSAAMRFLTGEKAAGLAHGAFKLGVASGVSSWQGGVDQMVDGFFGGAAMGTMFRGIATLNTIGHEPTRKFINALAGSLYTGLDSTLQGQTTPEQIYSYLEGAFFSWNEPKASEYAAAKFMKKASEKINQTAAGERKLYEDPEQHEGWHDLSFDAREIVKNQFNYHYRSIDWLIDQGLKKGLWGPEIAKEMRENLSAFDPKEYGEWERALRDDEKEDIIAASREAHQDSNPDSEFSGGIIPEDLKISRTVDSLVDRVLVGVIPEGKRTQAKVDITAEETRIVNEKPEQAAKEYIDFIEKYAGTVLEEGTRGQIRQRVMQRINQYPISHMTLELGKDNIAGEAKIVENGKLGPTGDILRATIDKPRIAEAYEQAAARLGVEANKDVLAILDHVVDARGNKIELDKLDQHLNDWVRKNFPYQERAGEAEWRRAKIFDKILSHARSAGFYYQGGRGDAGRLYMVRWHPEMPDSPDATRAMLGEFGRMMRELNAADPTGKAGWSEQNIMDEADARSEFIRSHPDLENAADYYDQATLSNILYNLEMNGFNGWADRAQITSGHFIKDPKAFNKRQQIWLTAGWKLDPTFEEYKGVKGLVDGNKINVQYKKDWEGAHGTLATEYTEATDGALIMRRDILTAMLKDMGVPTEGMIGKSFIVEPDSELGALLGKYAMHLADPATEAQMIKDKVHAIMFDSAAKQRGKRKNTFTIKIESFKGVPSEITDKHSIEKQRLAKQLLTNLTQFAHSPIHSGVIRDMIDSITRRGLLGTTEGNEAIAPVRLALEQGKEITDANVETFKKHIDDIEMQHLFDMVRHGNGARLADAFYRHVLRMETEEVRLAKEDGEATDFEVADADNTLSDYESIFQRLTANAPQGASIWQHKWVRPYVEKAVLNYVVRRVVRPKIENSGVFRLAPYTEEMAIHPATSHLQENRDIFLLHDRHRDLPIHSSLFHNKKGMMTLGEIVDHLEWSQAENKWVPKAGDTMFTNHIDRINELIRGVVVRVPMGSLSGAHVLRFGGFTGIDGFGGVTHPETTRAIGGADLDGDKAFYFFGDESQGFKPEWKDMYAANRDEFLDQGEPAVMVEKIISGGQTGADMGGLIAGRELGIATGGTAPPKWITEDGSQPDKLKAFGLVEGGPDPKVYPLRTMKNVDDSDGTIAFVVGKSVGTRNTIGYAQTGQWRFGFGSKDDGRKPVLEMTSTEFTEENVNKIASFIRRNGIRTLNVAGHRERSVPGIENNVSRLIKAGVERAREASNAKVEAGENIASGYNKKDPGSDLGRRLTNVTRDTSMDIQDVPGLRRPTRQHRGGTSLSAENWYLENQVGRGPTEENMAIMQRIIEQKFTEHPELVDEITAKGGSAWLDKSRHVVLGGPWEGEGIGSPFLSVLNKAYLAKGGVERVAGGTGRIPDLKNLHRQELSNTNERHKAFMSNPASMYSPHVRMMTSEAAYMGRASLKNAVTSRSIALSAHSTLVGMGGRYRLGFGKIGREETEIFLEARVGPSIMRKFQEFSRAAIELTADPMDEPGLKPGSEITKMIYSKLFKWVDANGKELDPSKIRSIEEGGENPAMRFHNYFSDVNSALYSRNYKEGRRWIYEEIQAMLKNMNDIVPDEAANSLFPRLAKSLYGVDWRDGMLQRLDVKAVTKMMEHLKSISKEKKFEYLKDLLERGTLSVDMSMIKTYMEMGLHTDEGWAREMAEGKLDRNLHLKLFPKNKKLQDRWSNTVPGTPRWHQRRASMLANVRAKFEDYVTNDLADVTTLLLVDRYAMRRMAESPETWENDVRLTREAVSRVRAQLRAEMDRFKELEAKEAEKTGDKLASSMRKINMDKVIQHYKSLLAKKIGGEEATHLPLSIRKLFDHMILGSFDYGTKRFDNQIARVRESDGVMASDMERWGYEIKGKDRLIGVEEAIAMIEKKKAELGEYITDVKSTRYLRYGFDSNIVGNDSIREHLAEWNKSFEERVSNVTMREKNKPLADAEKNVRVSQFITDEHGNRTGANLLDLRELTPDEELYRETIKPFEIGDKVEEYPELTAEFIKLKGHLEHYPLIRPKLHLVVRELFAKDFNAMNIGEIRSLNRFFEEARKGSIFSQFMKLIGKDGDQGIKRWYWNIFPEAINRDTMRKFMEGAKNRGIFIDRDGVKVIGDTMVPTGAMGILQKHAAYIEEAMTKSIEQENNKFNEIVFPYLHGIEDGPLLFQYAMARMEFEGSIPGVRSKEGEIKVLRERMEEEKARVDAQGMLEKLYTIEGQTITGEQLTRKLEAIVKTEMDKRHKWLVVDETFLENFFERDENGLRRMHKIVSVDLDPTKGKYYGVDSEMPKFDMKKLMGYIIDKVNSGEQIPLQLGLENLELIKRSILADELLAANQIDAYNSLITRNVEKTGKRNGYFPHISFTNPKKVVDAYTAKMREILDRTPTSKQEEMENINELRRLTMALQQLNGNMMVDLPSQAYYDKFDAMMEQTKGNPNRDQIKWEEADHRVQMMQKRAMHLDGWEISPAVLDLYTSRIVNSFYRSLGEIVARQQIRHIEEAHKSVMPENLAKAWSTFFKIYVNNSLGYPAILPDGVADNPDMKVRYTPYEWMNDLNTKRLLNNIVKKLNLDKSTHPSIKKLKGYEKVDYKTVMWLANMEARYEMAALLAHPKTAVANLLGGTINTVINAGLRNTLKANDIKYLRMINPKWKSMEDVDRSVREWGVIEEYLLKEAQYNPAFRSDKHKKFLKDLEATLKKDPNANDATLRDLAKRHGVWNEIFEKSAWFMRVTERKVRRDSFMAHYIQMKEKWGDALPYDHPILIQMAKKGVQATQFMYSNTFRPMFAQTALGKVMTRFQMYAWNSVKLRKNIINEAAWRGFEEGTVEFDRFKRLAIIDMLSLALASAFMYSIFDNNLPQPYSWAQDFANWMFGDEEEREKAFFGSWPTAIAPLQMITPPALRVVGPTVDWLLTGNHEKLANYHVWMMFPFGRIGRDLLGKNNLFDNPYQLLEKTTGFPLINLGRSLVEIGDGDPQGMFEHHSTTPGHWIKEASPEDEKKK